MYQIGALIVYGAEGVCRVEKIGPLGIKGTQQGVDYYTLTPLYRDGKIFTPVDTTVYTRPVMTKEEANALIAQIPDIPTEIYENSNPRLLNEHYQSYLKSYDCVDLIRLIQAICAKERSAADKGRHLGQVDERSMKRAEEMLHGELAAALEIPVEDVKDYICRAVEAMSQKTEGASEEKNAF
ncbi:MAG: CarD family transcriptional regulator [Lawsonibacter sp.]|nr:CarD family transcriptional regulator [Lawsonibacter sp.]